MRSGAGASLLAGVLVASAAPAAESASVSAPLPGTRESAIRSLGRTPCPRFEWIEIHKAERRLIAWCEDGSRISFVVALGRGPTDAKERQGDGRTPEGVYHIAAEARPSRFHLFIPLDYPSRTDAAVALANGVIAESTYREIMGAHEEGRLPRQDTPLGGAVGIHGEGEEWRGRSGRSNWTLGCIALRDADVERLASSVEPGTLVVIHP